MEGLEDLEEMLGSLTGAIEGLESPLADLRSALEGLTDAMGGLGSASEGAGDDVAAMGSKTKGASNSILSDFEGVAKAAQMVGDTAPAIAALGDTVKSLATGPVPDAQQAMAALGETMGGAITDGAHKLSEALATLGPEGEAAGAAIEALAAPIAAAVESFTTLMGLAISVTEKLGMMKDRFAALTGTAAGGAAVQAMIAHLNLPFATSQVNEWALSLEAAGIKGKQLEMDLKAVASAAALMPEGGAAAAENLFKRLGEGGPAADKFLKELQTGGRRAWQPLKDMGITMADLGGKAAIAKMNAEQLHKAIAQAMAKKGAGPLADMGNSMSVILMKAQEGFRSLFSKLGPAVKPFMAAVKSLFSEFNKGGSVIKLLQPIVTGVMTTLFSWGTRAVKVVHDLMTWLMNSGKAGGFFSGVVKAMHIGWSALVAIFGVVKTALAPMIGLLKQIFSNAMVLKGIKSIFTIIATVVMVLVVAFAAVVAGVVTMAAVVAGVFAGIVGAIAGAVGSIVDALTNFDFSAFIAKMGGMAQAGLAAFKGVFGIASPSAVLLEHGEEDMAGAAATGVDKGSGKLKSSMTKMADDATPKKGKAKGGAQGDGGGDGPSIVFNDCSFGNVDQGTIEKMLLVAWAKMAANAGARSEPAAR